MRSHRLKNARGHEDVVQVGGDSIRRCQTVLRTSCYTVFLILCVSVTSLSRVSETFASANADEPISEALSFLKGIQQPDGAISGFVTSCWSVMAIAAAGEDSHSWTGSSGQSIVDYLIENRDLLDLSKALDVARFILAMTAAEENPRNLNGVDYISILENLSVNGQIGYEAWVNDDFWAVLALISAGEPATSTFVSESVEFITRNQNADGGWGWGQRGVTASDVDDTAAAVMALVSAGEGRSSEIVENALQYLKDNQQSNGGFSNWGDINSNSDSWAMGAIVSVGQTPAQWKVSGASVIEHLLSLQNEDGSFNRTSNDYPGIDKGWNTAYAVVALSLNPYPVNMAPPSILGDFNLDGDIDYEDVVSFIDAYIAYEEEKVLVPEADFDNDSNIDREDLMALVYAYVAYWS
jgi:prenyltransferase beta subunit